MNKDDLVEFRHPPPEGRAPRDVIEDRALLPIPRPELLSRPEVLLPRSEELAPPLVLSAIQAAPINVLTSLLPDFRTALTSLTGDLAVIRMSLSYLRDELDKAEVMDRFIPKHMSPHIPKGGALSEVERAAEDALDCVAVLNKIYDSLRLGQAAGSLLEALAQKRHLRRG